MKKLFILVFLFGIMIVHFQGGNSKTFNDIERYIICSPNAHNYTRQLVLFKKGNQGFFGTQQRIIFEIRNIAGWEFIQ